MLWPLCIPTLSLLRSVATWQSTLKSSVFCYSSNSETFHKYLEIILDNIRTQKSQYHHMLVGNFIIQIIYGYLEPIGVDVFSRMFRLYDPVN
ncbi:hypothetical protein M0802_011348 [Mischocyttarus mexicanus]|nr:hypothetical protein M0802_011348 [Mischocyttarus mexicanus]